MVSAGAANLQTVAKNQNPFRILVLLSYSSNGLSYERTKELHIDRAYLSSHLVRKRSNELEVYCKAWPVREDKRFSKQAFTLDWERQIIRCPAEQEMPFVPGDVVHFPQEICVKCPLKAQCTTSSRGRSVSIHPDEAHIPQGRLSKTGIRRLDELPW